MLKKILTSRKENESNGPDTSAGIPHSEKFGFTMSALIHATFIFLGFVLSNYATSNLAKPLTIVLDGQLSFVAAFCDSNERKEALPREAAAHPKTPAVAKVVQPEPAPRTLQHAAMPEPLQRPEAFHGASDVVVKADPSESAAASLPANSVPVITAADSNSDPATGYVALSHSVAQSAYMKEHFTFIRDIIMKRLEYPSLARKMGWKGQLTVSFVICEGGRVENIRIVKSSGYKILDDNAVNTIKIIQPFPRPPAKAEIVIPIEYRFG